MKHNSIHARLLLLIQLPDRENINDVLHQVHLVRSPSKFDERDGQASHCFML